MGPVYGHQETGMAKKVQRAIWVLLMCIQFAPVWRTCLITLGIKYGGRQSQLLFPDQSQVKASTASEPGFQKRELNLGN